MDVAVLKEAWVMLQANCPGCAKAYLTGPSSIVPHDFGRCASYKRGFEDGYEQGRAHQREELGFTARHTPARIVREDEKSSKAEAVS